MIEKFKDNEIRNSGIIYSSTFEQIKKLYAMDPEQAGEFAIAAIELVLTGEISSDDYYIELMLEPTKKLNENNRSKYDSKKENAKLKKMTDMKLDKIAELINAGLKQSQVGERLGLSQQMISYRLGIIRTQYPELLTGAAAQINVKNTKKSTKIQKNDLEQTVQINVDDTKDFTNDTNSTNDTNNPDFCTNGTNFVQNENFCRSGETTTKMSREEWEKKGFHF